MSDSQVGRSASSWFMYYPGGDPVDYRWSASMLGILAAQLWRGSELGEVHRVGQRLLDRYGDEEAWFQEWVRLAAETKALARQFEEDGHSHTAADAYLRASCYFQWGEKCRLPKDDVAIHAYRSALDCFQRFRELSDGPRIERVEIACEGRRLPALYVHPAVTQTTGSPSVVFFPGLDQTKELTYARGVAELSRRGIGTLVLDSFGNGESVRFQGFPLRADSETAATAAYEYLSSRPDINPRRVGVVGISLGGYCAPRSAAYDGRFAVCVSWGAVWDYHQTWLQRVASQFSMAQSVPWDFMIWILQAEGTDDALAKLEGFKLDGVAQRVTCPTLVLHGAEDQQASVDAAHRLYSAIGARDKTLRIVTPDEGGAQHCTRDNMTFGSSFVADWIADRLLLR